MFFLSMKILFGIFGGYVITSLILFRRPTLLHKKKRQYFVCKHISHRGGAGEAYENTLAAFRRAVALGTDMLELDCHLTRDNQVVVSHDHSLLRSTGVDKMIAELDYSELPPLQLSIPIDFDPGRPYSGTNEEDRRIPLLRDIFQEFPKIPINIDIKINSDKLIKEVDALIRQYNREELTVWGNFSNKITTKCYAQNPKVGLLFSMKRVIHLILLFYSGLLPFVPIKESFLEIFLPSIFLRRLDKEPEADGLLPFPSLLLRITDLLLIRRSLFEHLRARGIQVYIWVLNSEDDYEQAFQLGATGVMTDYPSRLRQFLERNPQFSVKE